MCQRCAFSMSTLTHGPDAHQCKGGLKRAHRKNLILTSTPVIEGLVCRCLRFTVWTGNYLVQKGGGVATAEESQQGPNFRS